MVVGLDDLDLRALARDLAAADGRLERELEPLLADQLGLQRGPLGAARARRSRFGSLTGAAWW